MDAESSVVICIFSGYYRFLRKISCTVSLGFRQKSEYEHELDKQCESIQNRWIR